MKRFKVVPWSYEAKALFYNIFFRSNFGDASKAPEEYNTEAVMHAFMAGLGYGQSEFRPLEELLKEAMELENK